MKDLVSNAGIVMERMSEIEAVRNTIFDRSRKIVRETKQIIHSIHTGGNVGNEIRNLDIMIEDLTSILRDKPDYLNYSAAEDAMMEYAETRILYSVVTDTPIPSYDQLGISPGAWVLGLADSIGEMRRILLKDLIDSDLEHAQGIFGKMEEASDVIMMFDVPDSIIPIRRKQDIARSIMERTRADVTNAIVMGKVKK
jgi:translin